jgi:8-oxo-dGTP pyrophosphatase MutT (NUDIX family)
MDKEQSAGGVLSKNGKLMLVRVKNLMGEKVWTFPKGHIEKNETPRKAALREVWEETGWECKIIRPLFLARYSFERNGKPVSKTVRWYLMEPLLKSGRPMAGEIFSAQWLSPKLAEKRLKYKSDLKLLSLWKKLAQ